MTNDIGTIKAVAPSAVSSGSVKSLERTVQTGRAQDPREAGGAQEKRPQDAEQIDKVVSDLNHLVHDLHRELRFTVDHDSGDTVVKVVDRETDEVVRQIPSEELVQLRKRLQEAAGVFFQDSA